MGFEKIFCPRRRSCPGQVASSKKKHCFLETKSLPQAAQLPGTSGFFKKKMIFWAKICPRHRSCPGQVARSRTSGLFKKSQILDKKFCPRQRSCPGQVVSSKKTQFSGKSSAAGSEAARDKLLLIKKVDFLEKVLPQAAKLPGTSGFLLEKYDF